MKIKRIYIKNYKSIRNLDLNLNPKLNVFIGENGVGKSNIFEAITWLLGPTYPTFNSTTKGDHYLGDMDNKILIRMYYTDNYLLELDESKDKYQFSIKKGNDRPTSSSELREHFSSAYIGTDREIVDYLPSNRWSLLGRILLDINEKFLEEKIEIEGKEIKKSEKLKQELDRIRDELLFSVKDEEGNKIMDKFINILQTESANQMNINPEDFQINFNLYDPWNFYKTLQILVSEPDTGLKIQASQLGTGAQASITMAILRAYSEMKLARGNPIFIDEPELFFHPQAQRNFYQILRKLADKNKIQILYISHSPYFISLEHFDEIFVVRKTKERGTYIRTAEPKKFIKDLKIRTGIDSSENTMKLHYRNAYEQTADSLSSLEAFFARKVILVEGGSEALLLPYFFNIKNFDYQKEKLTIVKCGSKNELDRFFRLYSEFGIPCYIIFDGDSDKEGSEKINNELFELLGEKVIKDFPDGEVHDNYLGFEHDFNHSLEQAGLENVYNENNPENSPKGLKLFIKVKEQVEKSMVNIPEWIEQIIEKIRGLPEEADSVLEVEELPF